MPRQLIAYGHIASNNAATGRETDRGGLVKSLLRDKTQTQKATGSTDIKITASLLTVHYSSWGFEQILMTQAYSETLQSS